MFNPTLKRRETILFFLIMVINGITWIVSDIRVDKCARGRWSVIMVHWWPPMYCHIYFLLPLAFFPFFFFVSFLFHFQISSSTSVLLLLFFPLLFQKLLSSSSHFSSSQKSVASEAFGWLKRAHPAKKVVDWGEAWSKGGLICGRRGSLLQNSVISFSSLFFLYVKKGRSLKDLVFFV